MAKDKQTERNVQHITLKKNPIHYDIMKKKGVKEQLAKYTEELAELSKEVSKMSYGTGNKMNLAEEIADVLITAEGLLTNYGLFTYVDMFRKQKLERMKICYIEGEEK